MNRKNRSKGALRRPQGLLSRPVKAQIGESLISGSGKGLFAVIDIKKGGIIAEFKGKVRRSHEKTTSNRSNIFFSDDSVLECPDNDLASFANDCINFTRERRALLPALRSNEPFYKKHQGTDVNATINVNNHLHRAFLIAETDIAKGTEIFCHYGFEYWFMNEISGVGFSEDVPGELKNFPKRLFDFPAFTAYIHEFYTGVVKIETKRYDARVTDVLIHFNDGKVVCAPIKDYSQLVTKCLENELDNILIEADDE